MPDERPAARAAGEGSTEQATRPPARAPSWQPFVAPERLGEVGSTNAELAERARRGAPEGTVLIAESQRAGRGRLGRSWLDHPGGSILCSILFRPPWPPEAWPIVSSVVALAAIEAAGEVAGVSCACKWPNDLVAGEGEKKVAGILAETVARPGGAPGALVVGIGLNCNWPAGFPPPGAEGGAELAASATSLGRLAGREVDRDGVAGRLLAGVAARWGELSPPAAGGGPSSGALAALRSQYRAACVTLGRLVAVELAEERFVGRAVDVDERGALLVEVGGSLRRVEAGDLVHLRPSGSAAGG